MFDFNSIELIILAVNLILYFCYFVQDEGSIKTGLSFGTAICCLMLFGVMAADYIWGQNQGSLFCLFLSIVFLISGSGILFDHFFLLRPD